METAADHIWFRGNFATWDEARRASTGYDAPSILEKVRQATLKVVAGEAACERDSVTFDRIEYSLPLLVCLLYVASRSGNRLDVVDFGGSLGSSYWQNRGFLAHLRQLRWTVVEQPHFVRVGLEQIANDVLGFRNSVRDCLVTHTPDLLLLSSVIQYLDDPYSRLTTLLDHGFPFVVLDRTAFFVADVPTRLTIEDVHPAIYTASYPAWFLNLSEFSDFVDRSPYRIVEGFDSWERWEVDGLAAQNKCFLLERRTLAW